MTGNANPANLTADGETLVDANFNTVAAPLALTSLKPSSAKAGGAAFTLELTGTGFAPPPASLVSVNGVYRTVTYVSPTELTVPLTAADIASPGGFQVFVENFPPRWTGCAVFAYQTFFVEGKGAPAAEPVFSPPAGTYRSTQSVTLTDALPGAAIYYTINGGTPTTASPIYGGPITVSSTETLCSRASV